MNVGKPAEYILEKQEGQTLQYFPILQSMSQILNLKDIQKKAFNSYTTHKGRYESFQVTYLKENALRPLKT